MERGEVVLGAIEVKDLRAGYGSGEVLGGLTFAVDRGEKVAIMGPNGAGKTTLMRVLLRMIPYRGGAKILGMEVREIPQVELVRHASFMLPGDFVEDMVVGTYMELAGVEMGEDVFDVGHLMGRRLRSLSSGELQRVRLSRVFWSGREVLILDEPFTHLDPMYQIRLVEAIKGYGGTILFSIHDVLLAIRFFDRFILMKDGVLVSRSLSPRSFRETFGVPLQLFVG